MWDGSAHVDFHVRIASIYIYMSVVRLTLWYVGGPLKGKIGKSWKMENKLISIRMVNPDKRKTKTNYILKTIYRYVIFCINILFKCIRFVIVKLSNQRKKFRDEGFNENLIKVDEPIKNKKLEVVKSENKGDKFTLPSVNILDKISEHSNS